MVPGVVPAGAVPGVSTPPAGVTGVPGWPGTPTPGVVAVLPGAPGTPTVPGAPAAPGVAGTVVWANAAPLRPRPNRAVRSNLEDFIIGGEMKRKKLIAQLLTVG
jgi:hypothetical protein